MGSQCGPPSRHQRSRLSTRPKWLPWPDHCLLVQLLHLNVPLRISLGGSKDLLQVPEPKSEKGIPLSMGRPTKALTGEQMPLRDIWAAKDPAGSGRTWKNISA